MTVDWTPEEIRRRRDARGLSQQDLADALQVSRRAVTNWETGAAEPHGRNLRALDRVLGDTTPPAYSGQEIRQYRQRARLTQRQLAEKIGASERAVNRWESEGIPEGAQYLGALEQALGLGLATAAPGVGDALRAATVTELLAELHRRFAALEAATKESDLRGG